jgi:hypothetical protein
MQLLNKSLKELKRIFYKILGMSNGWTCKHRLLLNIPYGLIRLMVGTKIFNINNIEQEAQFILQEVVSEEGRLGYGFKNKHEHRFIVGSKGLSEHHKKPEF